MIDIGVNLSNTRFDKDREDVIFRAHQAGVNALLITGTSVDESIKAAKLCEDHTGYLFSTAGVHPHDADNVADNYLSSLESLANLPQVKAIGECGLDFNRNFSAPEQQIKVFGEQVELSAQLNLPLFLHQRDAFETWFKILSPYIDKIPALVAHCFTGSLTEAKRCLDANMYIGITGWLCDERRGQELRELVRYIPLDRLMIETDAPYLTPRTIRPKPKSSRNEPAYLIHIVNQLAELTEYSAEEIATQSQVNSRTVFNMEGKNGSSY